MKKKITQDPDIYIFLNVLKGESFSPFKSTFKGERRGKKTYIFFFNFENWTAVIFGWFFVRDVAMKPERGLQPNMEDKEWDPRELFITIGMLIVEARLPELSAKGRIEGPHCPQYPNEDTHVCSYQDIRCCEAQRQKTYMETLWKNQIPMCIELLLFPKCRHNQHNSEVTFLDSNAEYTGEEFLLERWDVHMFPKRWAEKSEDFVTGRFLIQAMRSYLFFSQLSSWLNSTGGVLPLKIAYRLYAPGESTSHMFQGESNVHHFPAADLPHSTVKVCVSALQRLKAIPILLCQKPKDLLVHRKPVKFTDQKLKGKHSTRHYVKNKKSATICDSVNKSDTLNSNQGTTTSEKVLAHSKSKGGTIIAKAQQSKFQPFCDAQPQAVLQRKTSSLLPPPSSTSVHSVLDDQDYSDSLASKFAKLDLKSNPHNLYTSASRQIFSEKPLVFHVKADSTCAYNNQNVENKMKLLHSPKVLLTNCNSDTQAYYSKQRHNSSDEKRTKDSDWYTTLLGQPSLHELSKPLTSDQIEAYLASLPAWGNSLPKVKRTCLENIPVTKCKFQIGDVNSETEDEEAVTKTPEKISSLPAPKYKSANLTDSNSQILSLKEKVQAKEKSRNDLEKACRDKDLSPTKPSSAVWLDFSSDGPAHVSDTEESSADQLISNGNVTDTSFSTINTLSSDCFSPDCKNRNVAHLNGVDLGQRPSPPSSPVAVSSPAQHLSPYNKNVDSLYLNGVEVNGNAVKCEGEEKEVTETDNNVSSEESPQKMPLNQIKRSLYASVLRKDFAQAVEKKCSKRDVPSMEDITNFHKHLNKSTSMLFNASTGLPTQSSPAPVKKKSGRFDYDSSLTSTKAIKNALSCSKLVTKTSSCDDIDNKENSEKTFSTSAPASTNCLLGNFEESILNGRIEPSGVVEGFTAEIGASGTFCPKHISLPVTSYFFSLSDDNAPSPYLGHINLETYSKKGYHIPKVGTVQVTLFNPNKTVVKMFVVMYDLQDMPSNAQTFMRQRTMYMPADAESQEPSYLRYLIHLRISSSRSGKLYLHTDIRLIFARDKFEYDARVANYELRSFTEGPKNPKFSPKR